MVNELSFRVLDAFVMELQSARIPNTNGIEARLEIDFEIVKSSFTPETASVAVECEYDVRVIQTPEDRDAPSGSEGSEQNRNEVADRASALAEHRPEEAVAATLRARIVVLMEADRVVTEDDAVEGRLNPAHGLAHLTAHPYLRSHIRYMSTAMSIPVIPLPVGIEDVVAMLEGASSA